MLTPHCCVWNSSEIRHRQALFLFGSSRGRHGGKIQRTSFATLMPWHRCARGTDSILVGVIILFDRSIHHIPKIIGFYRLVLAQDTDFSFAYSMYSYINAQEVKAKLQNSQRDKIGVFLSSFSSRTVPEHCIVRAPFLHGGLGIPHAGQTSQASHACVSAPPP
jgi:hypothetical protein